MTMFTEIPDIKRVRFRQGQPLAARDLADMQSNLTEIRWLQNRLFHGWGIVSGLTVSLSVDQSQVSVSAGFALDCKGREILLTENAFLTLPHIGESRRSETFYIVVSYRSDAKQQVVEHRASVCLPGGSVRLANHADIGWRQRNGLRRGFDIVLGRVSVRNCVVVDNLDFSVRKYLLASGRRSLASGRASSELEWLRVAGTAGVSAFIDTSSAGFQRTPNYRVEILGERTMSGGEILLMPISQIREPTVEGFTLNLLLPDFGGPGVNPLPIRKNPKRAIRELGWRIDWVGVGQ